MIYGSVCSGIEAATVAWHPLGWRAAWYAEIEKFPCAVLAHHYPDTPNLGDMTKITEDTLEQYGAIDVLVGGTPCQSFSVAGLRKGLADPRGNLALEFLRLADSARPRWLVWENVPGVRSSNGGRDFGAFLGALGELGYGWAYRSLDAQYFGLAQRRERVFVVGHLGDWRRAATVLFERHSLSGHPAPSRESREGFAGDVVSGADSGRRDVAHTLKGEGFDASEDGTGRGVPLVAVSAFADCYNGEVTGQVAATIGTRGSSVNSSGPTVIVPAALSFDWQKGNDKNNPRPSTMGVIQEQTNTLGSTRVPAVAFSCKDHGADAGELSPTLRAMNHSGSHANAGGQVAVAIQEDNQNGVTERSIAGSLRADAPGHQPCGTLARQGMIVRRLTPRECERLQGFPDDYTLIPWRKKPASECPDGPRYKAIGNSMAVPVMAWIGKRIVEVDEL